MTDGQRPPAHRTSLIRGSGPRGGTAARRLAVTALLLAIGCTGNRPVTPAAPAPLDPPALEAQWAATLSDVRTDIGSGRYAAADSAITAFLERHPGTPQSADALFWRAVLRLDPANEAGSPREALVAVDAYIAGGTALPNFELAQVLRRTASALESAQRPLPAPTRSVVAAPDSAERARAAEEILKLKTELDRVQTELDRIKKRIRP
ncbi:MAG: tetratricopeptide repeat protein [Gemmatimonadaceae bacterium]